MFNLGLFELGLFGVIALIVLGPQKLISAATTLGRWYGKIRRMSARLQSELVSELELTEVQNALKAQIDEIRASEAAMKAQMQELQAKLQQSELKQSLAQGKTNSDIHHQTTPQNHHPNHLSTTPLTYRFFLLGEYDKKRRLPPAPFLPNYQADKLLYQGGM